MKLYVIRHAIAGVRDPKRWPDDRERPLTKAGTRRLPQRRARASAAGPGGRRAPHEPPRPRTTDRGNPDEGGEVAGGGGAGCARAWDRRARGLRRPFALPPGARHRRGHRPRAGPEHAHRLRAGRRRRGRHAQGRRGLPRGRAERAPLAGLPRLAAATKGAARPSPSPVAAARARPRRFARSRLPRRTTRTLRRRCRHRRGARAPRTRSTPPAGGGGDRG